MSPLLRGRLSSDAASLLHACFAFAIRCSKGRESCVLRKHIQWVGIETYTQEEESALCELTLRQKSPTAAGSKAGRHGGPELTEHRADPGPAPRSTAGGTLGGCRVERDSETRRRWPGLPTKHGEDRWSALPGANIAEPELLSSVPPSCPLSLQASWGAG